MKTNKKVALITGASRGIGRQLAITFGNAGYHVVVNYNTNTKEAEHTVATIKQDSGSARSLKADVSNPAEVKGLIKDILNNERRIDILVNNAAIIKNNYVSNLSEAEWDDVIRTDLSGPFYIIRECSKLLMKQKSGAIINISSIIGARGGIGIGNYAAAKGGLISLTKSAAKELGRFNVCVNAILPGFHLTDMNTEFRDKYLSQTIQESVLGKTTDTKELADFILFLAGMQTISGQIFNWDSRII